MKKSLLPVLLGLCNFHALGQTSIDSAQRALIIDVGAFYTPILQRDVAGIYFGIYYQPVRRLSVGVRTSGLQRKLLTNYGYAISEPVISYFDVGLNVQYKALTFKKLSLNVGLTNGLGIARLGDDSKKQTFYTQYGSNYKPETKNTTYFYQLEPNVSLDFHLPDRPGRAAYLISLSSGYRLLAGSPPYARTEDFSNYNIGLGLKMIGILQ